MRIVDARGERTNDETRAFLKTICLPPENDASPSETRFQSETHENQHRYR
jgi:hypothetical protein